tara:strand:+ start:918 stop:1151 length:234 start_codon:yes stop_codon:yes gene_type:complete
MPKFYTQAAQDRDKNKRTEERLNKEAIEAEKERIRLEEIEIQRQIREGVFKGAKGGILKMRSGGRIDGCAIRGKTRA